MHTCTQCNLPKKSCQHLHLLTDEKSQIVAALNEKLPQMVYSHENGSPPMCSRASIGFSEISVPLAWKTDQHFKSKGDSRTYSMFLVFQTRNRVVDTKMITNIDRTMTDVVVSDAFVFENEPEDFCVEVSIYAARTDYGMIDNGGSLRNKISRSLGRKFGSSVRTSLAQNEKRGVRPDAKLGSTHFNLLARAYLSFNDAGEDSKIHDLKVSAFADLSGPPLYGNLICRMTIQPHSVQRPIAEGVLSIHHVEEDVFLRKVFVRLQGGCLQCFTIGEINHGDFETLLVAPLSKHSKVTGTTRPLTIVVRTRESEDSQASELYIMAENERTLEIWHNSIQHQIEDIIAWGKFAVKQSKLIAEKRVDPVKETLSRAIGENLYDKISITGSVSKASLGAPFALYEPRKLSPLRGETAPVKRHKMRANVIDLFQATNGTSSYIEPPTYVLQLNIGEQKERSFFPTIKEESVSSYKPLTQPKALHPVPKAALSTSPSSLGDGKKSWSRSLGAMIGRKVNSVQVTRL